MGDVDGRVSNGGSPGTWKPVALAPRISESGFVMIPGVQREEAEAVLLERRRDAGRHLRGRQVAWAAASMTTIRPLSTGQERGWDGGEASVRGGEDGDGAIGGLGAGVEDDQGQWTGGVGGEGREAGWGVGFVLYGRGGVGLGFVLWRGGGGGGFVWHGGGEGGLGFVLSEAVEFVEGLAAEAFGGAEVAVEAEEFGGGVEGREGGGGCRAGRSRVSQKRLPSVSRAEVWSRRNCARFARASEGSGRRGARYRGEKWWGRWG